MVTDLFAKDIGAINEAQEALDDGQKDPEVLRGLLVALTKAHSKTVKRAEKLVRVSDRTEVRLRAASSKIEEQSREIENARKKLSDHADSLELQVAERTKQLQQEQAKLEKLVDLGIAMAAERDEGRLLSMILNGAMDLTNADGGTFYLVTDDQKALQFRLIRNLTLDIDLGGTPDRPVSLPNVVLVDGETGKTNHANVASNAVLTRGTVNIPDAYCSKDYDFTGTRKFDEANGYKSTSFLTVPLIPRGGAVIGALQLINATAPETGDIVPFDSELQGFVEALAAQGAMLIDNQKLLVAQRQLMDSFIELIAGAIDAKSPYTGGHCNRVPEIALMLAEEAHECRDGPFADFEFHDEEERREFRIGAWLHDCGKVITPEHVVDKATKLETIHNRLHEVRARFEILYRDRIIDAMRNRIEDSGAAIPDDTEFEADLERLRSEFAFVADCNVGGEYLDDESIARLQEIGQQTWQRYFDDRLGLSPEEARRLQDSPIQPLPAEEQLLSDKSCHINPRTPGSAQFFADRGFRMDVPANHSNLGEIYNLSIRRGTLTDEERFKINEHIIQTIVMLETLPLPANLRRIPEIAGGHHETMIGTGYPRKLTKDEMSVAARIMAVADIFEALTAADRPYKKAKTLSESLKIMGFMCKDGHIDPELFELFLERGIYQRYADDYLDPSQVDEVPIDTLLETARSCANH